MAGRGPPPKGRSPAKAASTPPLPSFFGLGLGAFAPNTAPCSTAHRSTACSAQRNTACSAQRSTACSAQRAWRMLCSACGRALVRPNSTHNSERTTRKDQNKHAASAAVRTSGGSCGQACPGCRPGGSCTSTPSGSGAQPMSYAEHSMPSLSTPRSTARSMASPLPGVVEPTACGRPRAGQSRSCGGLSSAAASHQCPPSYRLPPFL